MAEMDAEGSVSDALEAMWNASESGPTDSPDGIASDGFTAAGDMDGPWAEMAWCLYSTMRWEYLP